MGVHFLQKPAIGKPLSPLRYARGNQIKPRYSINRRIGLVFQQTPLAITLTVVTLICLTYALHFLQPILRGSSPYLNLYFIPVVYAGACLGSRGAYIASTSALLLAYWFLFSHSANGFGFVDSDEILRFLALSLMIFILATVTGRLYDTLQNLRQSEEHRLSFNREVLSAVTGGRLLLCDQAALFEMLPGEPIQTLALNTFADVPEIRHCLLEVVKEKQIAFPRLEDFCTCVTEALSNAVKYGEHGVVRFWISSKQLSVVVSDKGPGISPTNLARATLERGFSTQQTLGMGFTMMMATADLLVLSTSEAGTDILLQINNQPLITLEDELLARS